MIFFPTAVRIILKISNLIKIRPVGAWLSHEDRGTDGRTDTRKLIVAFRKFANASKKGEVATLQAMKAYGVRGGTGRYLHPFLSSVVRVSVWLHDSFALLSEK